ncbi:immune-associated nucleotide-binding protein 1 [Elysia marginata]|uniref:Immune-associated nucleotide-binding protein 1 n=1 Tax=Elysia marginata TaxID=1093978 RepID=A0AAV4GZJ5_9GAST|nr:immune-associated nucleotide-binding protein 1 [Elysia marginata]
MLITPEGYHAFLYIAKYPSHFTEEDAKVFETLKEILNPDVAQKHCILIITGGDEFRCNEKEKGKPFERWVLNQTGKFAELVRECGNRIVLFDNKTEDKTIQQAQLDELLAEVNKLQKANGVYTDENFERAKALRELQKYEAKGAVIEEITLDKFRLLLDKVHSSDHKEEGDKKTEVVKMKREGEILKDLEEIYEDLKKRQRYRVSTKVACGIGMSVAIIAMYCIRRT